MSFYIKYLNSKRFHHRTPTYLVAGSIKKGIVWFKKILFDLWDDPAKGNNFAKCGMVHNKKGSISLNRNMFLKNLFQY